MKITEVKYRAVNKGKLLGEATVTLDGEFEVDVKIINGSNGKFLMYPNREYEKNGEKKTWNLCRWKDRTMGDNFAKAVIDRIPELGYAQGF